jgi:hypothetical protein
MNLINKTGVPTGIRCDIKCLIEENQEKMMIPNQKE